MAFCRLRAAFVDVYFAKRNGINMIEPNKIPESVSIFLEKASADIGRIEIEVFSEDVFCKLSENNLITSPIEQLFYIALRVMCRAARERFCHDPEFVDGKPVFLDGGVFLTPQYKVGNYRVDFLVRRIGFGRSAIPRDVIVELDGHEFHDKDKRQRSYEKARDRFLSRQGHTVLHYTGSDVVADPYRVAHEVLDTLLAYGRMGAEPYDKTNPLGSAFE